MKTRLLCKLVVCPLALGLFAHSVFAETQESQSVTRGIATLSSQPHPKKLEVAYLVMERHRVKEASINYQLSRANWSSCCDIDLESGGKMIGSLELITESGTQKWRKKKSKCVNRLFEDLNYRSCGVWWPIKTEVQPGDVLLWTVKFKSMPRLEREPYEHSSGNTFFYVDRLTLRGDLLPPDPPE